MSVPLGRALLQHLPGLAAVFLAGLVFHGLTWAAVSTAICLAFIFVLRAWARRRYGVATPQPPESA